MLIYSDTPIFTARFDAIEESYDGPDICYFFDDEVCTRTREAAGPNLIWSCSKSDPRHQQR